MRRDVLTVIRVGSPNAVNPFATKATQQNEVVTVCSFSNYQGETNKYLTQLSGFSEHEMNNPLALCELAARAPNISASHIVKQAWLPNDRIFILDFH